MQAHITGRRDEWQRLAGAGNVPGGRIFTPVEEVGSGLKHRDVYYDERILMGGGY